MPRVTQTSLVLETTVYARESTQWSLCLSTHAPTNFAVSVSETPKWSVVILRLWRNYFCGIPQWHGPVFIFFCVKPCISIFPELLCTQHPYVFSVVVWSWFSMLEQFYLNFPWITENYHQWNLLEKIQIQLLFDNQYCSYQPMPFYDRKKRSPYLKFRSIMWRTCVSLQPLHNLTWNWHFRSNIIVNMFSCFHWSICKVFIPMCG